MDPIDQLMTLPNFGRSGPVTGSPEWWYQRTGMIPTGFDSTTGNPILTKPADLWSAISLPNTGVMGWLQQHQSAVLISAAGLFALAMLGVRR